MRADRLLSLLMLLQIRGRMSARQLAAELEVCERTIYRDIVALSSAGVPVYGEAGPEGGYQLLDSYRTNLTGLTEGEARALFMLNAPGLLARLGLSQDFKAAMLKLTAALPAARRQDEERVRRRYHIDTSGWSPTEEPLPHLQTIQQAVWDDRQVMITYSPLLDVQIERVVDPYGLVARSDIWYLVAARQGRVRALQVSDLLQVRMCSDTFVRPADFDLGEFWRGWCVQEDLSRSDFPVTVRAAARALTELARQFRSQVQDQLGGELAEGSGGKILTLYFRSIGEARDRLLSFGSGVEVLEPFVLRAHIADIAEQTARLYRKQQGSEDS